MANLNVIPHAINKVLGTGNYFFYFLILSILFFFLYVTVPVVTTPGNSYAFFFASNSAFDISIIALSSIMVGLIATLQIYLWKVGRSHMKKGAALAGAGFFSGIISTLFATASCMACLSAIFSFLGVAGVTFLVEHRSEIIAFSVIFIILALYLNSKKIDEDCKECKI